jgi:hypothetical protein
MPTTPSDRQRWRFIHAPDQTPESLRETEPFLFVQEPTDFVLATPRFDC